MDNLYPVISNTDLAIDQNKEILEVVKEENESIEIVEVTSKVEDLTNMKKVVSKKGAPKKGNK